MMKSSFSILPLASPATSLGATKGRQTFEEVYRLRWKMKSHVTYTLMAPSCWKLMFEGISLHHLEGSVMEITWVVVRFG